MTEDKQTLLASSFLLNGKNPFPKQHLGVKATVEVIPEIYVSYPCPQLRQEMYLTHAWDVRTRMIRMGSIWQPEKQKNEILNKLISTNSSIAVNQIQEMCDMLHTCTRSNAPESRHEGQKVGQMRLEI